MGHLDRLRALIVGLAVLFVANRRKIREQIQRDRVATATADVTANCARKQTRSDSDPCGAICPDLPKVL